MLNQNLKEYISLYVASVAFVNLVPGPWRKWSRYGEPLDAWTGMHFLWGAIARHYGLSFNEMMVLSLGNEIAEDFIRKNIPQFKWGKGESFSNIYLDVAANAAGWLAARQIWGPR